MMFADDILVETRPLVYAQQTIDAACNAAHNAADYASHNAANRAGDRVAPIGAFLAAADDALGVRSARRRDHERQGRNFQNIIRHHFHLSWIAPRILLTEQNGVTLHGKFCRAFDDLEWTYTGIVLAKTA